MDEKKGKKGKKCVWDGRRRRRMGKDSSKQYIRLKWSTV